MLQALQVIGTGLKIFGAMQQAKAAKQQAAYDAANLEYQKVQEELAALQRMNLRNAEFNSNEATNRATLFSGLNRDPSDRSLKAFFAKQREIYQDDIGAIEGQTQSRMAQIDLQKQVSLARGRSAYQAALLGAGTALTSGLFRYEQIKTGKSLFDMG